MRPLWEARAKVAIGGLYVLVGCQKVFFYILTMYLAKESRISAGGCVLAVVGSSPLTFFPASNKATISEFYTCTCVGVAQKQRTEKQD